VPLPPKSQRKTPPAAESGPRPMDFRYQSTSWGFEADVFAVCVGDGLVTSMHQQNLSTICAEGLQEHTPGTTGAGRESSPPKSSIRDMIWVSLGSFFCQRSSESKTLESEPNAYLHRSQTDRPVAVFGQVARCGQGICRWRPICHRRRRWLAGGFGSRTCPRYECHQATLNACVFDAD
jgi:hypothetical protein